MAFRGVPDGRAPAKGRYFGQFLVPIVILQTVSSSNSTCKIHHETCRNERIRKSRMQITKIRKIKAATCSHYNRGSRRKIEQILRSLVAPLRGAGGFSEFCRIRSHDAPLPISSTSSSNILKRMHFPDEVVWHNPFVSDITFYDSDLQTMRLKQYDCTTSGLKIRSNSSKQKERFVAFQELLLAFSDRDYRHSDNSG